MRSEFPSDDQSPAPRSARQPHLPPHLPPHPAARTDSGRSSQRHRATPEGPFDHRTPPTEPIPLRGVTDDESTHLTQATYDRLQAELEDLTTRGRVEIARAIEAARALGDLSENGDYHAAKDTQGKMESRIRQAPAHAQPCRHRRRRGRRQLRDGGDGVGRGHPLRRRRRDRAVPGRVDRGAPRRAQRRVPRLPAGPGPARASPRGTSSSTRRRAAPCGSRSSRSAVDQWPRPRPHARCSDKVWDRHLVHQRRR